jgi:hypothetical protein
VKLTKRLDIDITRTDVLSACIVVGVLALLIAAVWRNR